MDKIFLIRTYDNILKIGTGQKDNDKTSCLLDYPYFKEHYKTIAIDLSRAIQQINFSGNLDEVEV